MASSEIDAYLAALEEPQQTTLATLRATIRQLLPDADEGMAYGLPAFRVQGAVVAGFGAFKNHLSYLPHSGSVLNQLGDELAEYVTSKGALQFPVDASLPRSLVATLLRVRQEELRPKQ